jgi:hypothetical protein
MEGNQLLVEAYHTQWTTELKGFHISKVKFSYSFQNEISFVPFSDLFHHADCHYEPIYIRTLCVHGNVSAEQIMLQLKAI